MICVNKVQVISKADFLVLIWTKKRTKMGQIEKVKGLGSILHNRHMYFLIWPTYVKSLGQKSKNQKRKFALEINLPLVSEGLSTFFMYLPTLTCRIIIQQILLILVEKNTYTTLLEPTRLLILRWYPTYTFIQTYMINVWCQVWISLKKRTNYLWNALKCSKNLYF